MMDRSAPVELASCCSTAPGDHPAHGRGSCCRRCSDRRCRQRDCRGCRKSTCRASPVWPRARPRLQASERCWPGPPGWPANRPIPACQWCAHRPRASRRACWWPQAELFEEAVEKSGHVLFLFGTLRWCRILGEDRARATDRGVKGHRFPVQIFHCQCIHHSRRVSATLPSGRGWCRLESTRGSNSIFVIPRQPCVSAPIQHAVAVFDADPAAGRHGVRVDR